MSDYTSFETFKYFSCTNFRPEMTHGEIISWFQARLNRNPEAYDVYQVFFI